MADNHLRRSRRESREVAACTACCNKQNITTDQFVQHLACLDNNLPVAVCQRHVTALNNADLAGTNHCGICAETVEAGDGHFSCRNPICPEPFFCVDCKTDGAYPFSSRLCRSCVHRRVVLDKVLEEETLEVDTFEEYSEEESEEETFKVDLTGDNSSHDCEEASAEVAPLPPRPASANANSNREYAIAFQAAVKASNESEDFVVVDDDDDDDDDTGGQEYSDYEDDDDALAAEEEEDSEPATVDAECQLQFMVRTSCGSSEAAHYYLEESGGLEGAAELFNADVAAIVSSNSHDNESGSDDSDENSCTLNGDEEISIDTKESGSIDSFINDFNVDDDRSASAVDHDPITTDLPPPPSPPPSPPRLSTTSTFSAGNRKAAPSSNKPVRSSDNNGDRGASSVPRKSSTNKPSRTLAAIFSAGNRKAAPSSNKPVRSSDNNGDRGASGPRSNTDFVLSFAPDKRQEKNGISLSIAPHEKERSPMRKAAERWLAMHPYWLTHGFPSGPPTPTPLGQAYKDMKAYVRAELTDENGVWEYPTETAAFKSRLKNATICVRIPFGINRPTTGMASGHKRTKGDPSSCSWEGIKENFRRNPIMLLRRQACDKRWQQSDHGRLVRQMHGAARRTALRAIKKEMDLETTIQSLGALSAGEAAQQAMNTTRSKMNSTTVLDYATNIGAVYIFYTERDDEDGVEFESLRFVIQGQDSYGKGKGNHNAVLMWNPSLKQFPKNICPYEARFDYGFERITKKECFILGIDFVTMVDAVMTRTEGLKVEKVCQYAINDLRLGQQRLHRVPGASGFKPGDGTKQRRIIGATFLPPGFFKDNPDIVIVGSADGRH
jgi:hypothetical protein